VNELKQLFSEIPYIKSERLILRKIEDADAEALSELAHSPNVYRYLPAFLFEQKYEDIHYVIRHLYDECFKESIILGVFMEEEFCGLAEIYGYREDTHKASIGCRFMERCWGKGIATEVVRALVRYLAQETDIEIITASTMVENKAITRVTEKNDFQLAVSGVDEDWGYPQPTSVNKWIWVL
jgi:Acetyltransferases, including N-acetylases of ribosomal proteins